MLRLYHLLFVPICLRMSSSMVIHYESSEKDSSGPDRAVQTQIVMIKSPGDQYHKTWILGVSSKVAAAIAKSSLFQELTQD